MLSDKIRLFSQGNETVAFFRKIKTILLLKQL